MILNTLTLRHLTFKDSIRSVNAITNSTKVTECYNDYISLQWNNHTLKLLHEFIYKLSELRTKKWKDKVSSIKMLHCKESPIQFMRLFETSNLRSTFWRTLKSILTNDEICSWLIYRVTRYYERNGENISKIKSIQTSKLLHVAKFFSTCSDMHQQW